LLEACLEVIETGAVVGMQDMGAAGIICSTAEMSAKGEAGMRIDLDKVPTRQQNMKAWELLLSESQERMLLVVEKGREAEVKRVFDKWDLESAVIGEVTDDGILNFFIAGNLEASIPAQELVLGGGAPQYDREFKEPAYFNQIKKFDIDSVDQPRDLKNIAEQIISLPSVASKRWIFNQYDSMVGTANTSTNTPTDAAVVLVRETGKGLAVTVDCNSRYVFADPYKGAMIAVAEAARNIVCSGGKPLGVTNCLNFGNPYDPEVYYQFVHAVKGMGEACRKFNTPVTGGNVSFYNQNPDGPVYPTPTIGMVGLVDDPNKKMTLDFKQTGDQIFLIGEIKNDINCSQYLSKIHGVEFSPAPHFDLEEELRLQELVADLAENEMIASAHDISEGGLFVTLIESGLNRNKGFDIRSEGTIRKDAFWFGEAQSRIVVTVSAGQSERLQNHLSKSGVSYLSIGTVTNGSIRIDGEDWKQIEYWKELYNSVIEKQLEKELESEGALGML
jgi:phosphoribosylformylglycinamidine synthase II